MNTPESRNDETAEMLRRAMAAEAAEVETDATALQRIQRRTTSAPSSGRDRWVFGALGAAAATAAVIAAVVVIGDNSGTGSNGTPPANQPTTPATAEVTVYYVGPQPSNPTLPPRLYSEPHTVELGDATAAEAAAHEFLTSEPIDPDYESGWPQGVDIAGITEEGDITTIALEGDADLGTTGEMEGTCLSQPQSVQALLRTAGVEEAARFTYNGDRVDHFFYCVDVSPSVAVQSDNDVRAFITIDNIVEGQTVSSPVTVTVSGNVFEGNVNWQLLDRNGAAVDEGFVTTSMGTWTQAQIELGALEPGTHTIRALEYSAEDGSPTNVDDKTITVE